MPLGMYEIYLEEMERIKAVEKLDLVNTIALGNGLYKAGDSQRALLNLERKANQGQSRETPAATALDLAEMGIESVTVKKNG